MNGKMLIFGGIHEITKELNDMHIYNFLENTWTKIYEEYSVIPPEQNRSAMQKSSALEPQTSITPYANDGLNERSSTSMVVA